MNYFGILFLKPNSLELIGYLMNFFMHFQCSGNGLDANFSSIETALVKSGLVLLLKNRSEPIISF